MKEIWDLWLYFAKVEKLNIFIALINFLFSKGDLKCGKKALLANLKGKTCEILFIPTLN
jgi:hypothetical protein